MFHSEIIDLMILFLWQRNSLNDEKTSLNIGLQQCSLFQCFSMFHKTIKEAVLLSFEIALFIFCSERGIWNFFRIVSFHHFSVLLYLMCSWYETRDLLKIFLWNFLLCPYKLSASRKTATLESSWFESEIRTNSFFLSMMIVDGFSCGGWKKREYENFSFRRPNENDGEKKKVLLWIVEGHF
jgi:hypothetical protein